LHGAWCWRDLVPELRSRGLTAKTIDLPGHGADPTPPAGITFEDYARRVLDNLGPRTLLVGHGMAGYPISAAAEAASDRVAGLVYLSAFIPEAGKSISDLRAGAPVDPLEGKTHPSDDGVCFSICPLVVEETLYHDCPPGVLTYAAARINREPIAPMRTPLNALTRADKLLRFAILTEQDRMLGIACQEQMARDIPADHVTRLQTSHASFFADPVGLATRIAQIAAQV
jgi:pimeloyl-ACP methyl ester carboxylesterase